MEHRAVRGAVGEQHLDHLVVRVAVVDLQREAQLLGQRDVRAERLALDLAARGSGAEVVEAGLADGADAGVGAGDRLDPRDRVGQRRRRSGGSGSSPSGAASTTPAWRTASFGWMATAPSSCVVRRGRPASVQAIASRSQPTCTIRGHADGRRARRGARRGRASASQPVRLPRHHRVEVRVVVDDRDRQRLGRRGPAPLPLRPRHHAWRSRSSSSSTIESSSLVNTGTGLATGVPGTSGLDRHGATVRPSS